MSRRRALALNAGSSSLKWGLFEVATASESLWETPVAAGARDGAADVGAAVGEAIAELQRKDRLQGLVAVGHRVVHGGPRYLAPARIDGPLKAELRAWAPLVPLHNPAALAGMEAAAAALPQALQVAAFDTGYYATLSEAERTYPIPWEWTKQFGIRRFGFHGLSHAGAAARAAALGAGPRVISCHLGSGCSATASLGGQAVATTMGFTPLDGLMMGHRSGAVDPSILIYLMREHRLTVAEVSQGLEHQGGLAGVSGLSDDLRQIDAAVAAGGARAQLAFDMYVSRISAAVAALMVALGGLDALIFTGGVGEHSVSVRRSVVARLEVLGLELDATANAAGALDVDLAGPGSRAKIFALRAREELAVARAALAVLDGG